MVTRSEIAGHGAKIARKQEDAIGALLTQPTLAAAAGVVGIGEKTLRRWLQDPGFQAAYQQARREAFGRAMGRAQQAAARAISVLIETMEDPKAPPSIRVRAAEDVWKIAHETFRTEDLESRLSRLEELSSRKRAA
jgi:uncharacterized protein YggE